MSFCSLNLKIIWGTCWPWTISTTFDVNRCWVTRGCDSGVYHVPPFSLSLNPPAIAVNYPTAPRKYFFIWLRKRCIWREQNPGNKLLWSPTINSDQEKWSAWESVSRSDRKEQKNLVINQIRMDEIMLPFRALTTPSPISSTPQIRPLFMYQVVVLLSFSPRLHRSTR
jgi:hypothetical protein